MSDYAKGFRDGFSAGLEEGIKILEEKWRQDKIRELEKSMPQTYPSVRDTCPKCGIKINGVMGYVCSSINCPSYLRVTSGTQPLTAGAVGSTYAGAQGYNGANGPAGPYDGPEYDNKVWVNGTWADLGR